MITDLTDDDEVSMTLQVEETVADPSEGMPEMVPYDSENVNSMNIGANEEIGELIFFFIVFCG